MSFFSSLILFYPGKPPIITAGLLKDFAQTLRDSVGIKPESDTSIELKWGEAIDQDYENTFSIVWAESGLMGTTREFSWDFKNRDASWESVLRNVPEEQGNLYRGYVSLGWLTSEASNSLTAYDETDDRSFIAPDCASVRIDPICPTTLAAEESVCTGLVSVDFAGNGYFTWGRSLSEYSQQYRNAPPVIAARRICREFFPVPRSRRFDKIADHLGELFLNRDYYEEGDWILSISETG